MNSAVPVAFAPGRRRRASAYAAGSAASSVIATTATDTSAVLTTQAPNHVWVNSRSKCFKVGGRWNHSGNCMR